MWIANDLKSEYYKLLFESYYFYITAYANSTASNGYATDVKWEGVSVYKRASWAWEKEDIYQN